MRLLNLLRFISVCLIGMILIFGVILDNSRADWGTSTEDCNNYHGITIHYGRFIPNLEITLDGVINESAWNRPDVYDYILPVMNMNQSVDHYVKYIHMRYLYDNNSLYLFARWDDDTIPQIRDTFMICWNINCTNYTVGMFLTNQSMETNQFNGRVDSWKWGCNNFPNYSQSFVVDTYYDHEGWPENNLESYDPRAGYSYEVDTLGRGYYQLEIKRSFLTSEPDVDTQFYLNSSIRFSIAIDNSLGGAEHAVSWTHELDFNNGTIPDETSTTPTTSIQIFSYSITWVIIDGVITLTVLSLYLRKRFRG